MASKGETALQALHAALQAAGLTVERNSPAPEEAQDGVVIILHDGDPGAPEITMSPLAYQFDHVADLDVIVFGDERDETFDLIRGKVAGALTADRSLGGVCDWAEARAPQLSDLYTQGGWPAKAATIQIVLTYVTADPLT